MSHATAANSIHAWLMYHLVLPCTALCCLFPQIQVKVLPVSQEMLQLPLELAVQQEEIDWSSPRPPQWIMGGAWGSQRTLMFSGEDERSAERGWQPFMHGVNRTKVGSNVLHTSPAKQSAVQHDCHPLCLTFS
jgi:hypothetical protein